MHGWTNESGNQWTNVPMKEWLTESTNQPAMNWWINEPVNQCIDDSVKQWTIQWDNESKNRWASERTNQWISERMNELSSEWMNQWTTDSVNPWTNESLNPWIGWAFLLLHWAIFSDVPILYLGDFCVEQPPAAIPASRPIDQCNVSAHHGDSNASMRC